MRAALGRALFLCALLHGLAPRGAVGSSYDAFYGNNRGSQGAQPPGSLSSKEGKPGGANPMDEVHKHIANTRAMVEGAARHARWFNVANGLLLMVTGPFNVILSAITLRLTDLMSSMYLSMFGVLLVAMEIPLGSLQRPMREYFRFLYTRFGRATFLLLVSNLAMVCGKVGFITAAFTIGNALLQLYLLGRNKDANKEEANLLSSTMAQVSDEMSGQMKSVLGPLRFLGLGGVARMWPFGRRARGQGTGPDEDDGFDNPFASEAEQGADRGSQEKPAGGASDGAGRRYTDDGPGGRSPFQESPPTERSAFGPPPQSQGSGQGYGSGPGQQRQSPPQQQQWGPPQGQDGYQRPPGSGPPGWGPPMPNDPRAQGGPGSYGQGPYPGQGQGGPGGQGGNQGPGRQNPW